MAYAPIVNVDITISDVQVSSEGFGTPMFITAHRDSITRSLSYSSAEEVGAFHGTSSAAYKAAVKAFGQSPRITTFKVGRRDAELRLTPVDFTTGETLQFTITNKSGVSFVASYVVQAGDTAAEIVTGLKASIDTSSDALEDCLPVTQTNTLVLRTVGAGGTWQDSYFTVTNYSSTSNGFFSGADRWYGTESAAQVYQEISEEDNDFFFITADDNQKTFALGMAAVVSTLDKMYFVSDSDPLAIAAVTDPDTSLFGELSALDYDNTVTFFHQDAGSSAIAGDHEVSDYPEVAYVGANAVYPAGSVSWANIALTGVTESRAANGLRLTSTQKENLNLRNSNYLEYDAGNRFVRYGQTVGNEWIDTVRGVYWQTSDLHANVKALVLGQKGGKLTYDNSGIARVREVISSSLQRGVNRNFLSNYTVNMPRLSDISSATKLSRVLENVTFQADVAGAIHEIKISGTVSEG